MRKALKYVLLVVGLLSVGIFAYMYNKAASLDILLMDSQLGNFYVHGSRYFLIAGIILIAGCGILSFVGKKPRKEEVSEASTELVQNQDTDQSLTHKPMDKEEANNQQPVQGEVLSEEQKQESYDGGKPEIKQLTEDYSKTKLCSNCRKENQPDDNFCIECGTKL